MEERGASDQKYQSACLRFLRIGAQAEVLTGFQG
jgi:hypothetical protein